MFFNLSGCYPQAPKKIVVSEGYSWDFQEVKEGSVLKHIFILKNASGKILNIKGIDTSCGCTVSEVAKRSLSPGEETKLEVTFNTKGYSGLTQQFIYVHTDDLDNPVVRYIIKAKVIKHN
ncbi:MAG: DUF1573 domain-containing protein [Candidatus Omnitrophica bacterium]|nr:DUF1573 domain-containing protein [Candidatus Omnitrophota bacterium]